MTEKVATQEISAEDVDKLMSEIGFRLINQHLNRPPASDDIDDIIADKLTSATNGQRFEVADILIDILAVSELLKQGLSDDGKLDQEEVRELGAFITDLADDSKAVIKSLVG